ncbi:DUF6783 domain-containing protein [Blautia sp.]|uniref:DUF6783 domain-containing protein n=1 Tax=Blautia sp. TaxID=1955243 RepID=UPI003AB46085
MKIPPFRRGKTHNIIIKKSSTSCDAHLAESLFQTRSSIINMETDRRCYSR